MFTCLCGCLRAGGGRAAPPPVLRLRGQRAPSRVYAQDFHAVQAGSRAPLSRKLRQLEGRLRGTADGYLTLSVVRPTSGGGRGPGGSGNSLRARRQRTGRLTHRLHAAAALADDAAGAAAAAGTFRTSAGG
jgi:hypothetical protein